LYIPETQGVPLEEIAELFGDQDEVTIFSEDIRVDRTTRELVVDTRGGSAAGDERVMHRVGTEASTAENIQESLVEKV